MTLGPALVRVTIVTLLGGLLHCQSITSFFGHIRDDYALASKLDEVEYSEPRDTLAQHIIDDIAQAHEQRLNNDSVYRLTSAKGRLKLELKGPKHELDALAKLNYPSNVDVSLSYQSRLILPTTDRSKPEPRQLIEFWSAREFYQLEPMDGTESYKIFIHAQIDRKRLFKRELELLQKINPSKANIENHSSPQKSGI
jgi:hypothetical protein